MSENPDINPYREDDEREDDGYFQDVAEQRVEQWASRRDTAIEARHYHYPQNGDLPA